MTRKFGRNVCARPWIRGRFAVSGEVNLGVASRRRHKRSSLHDPVHPVHPVDLTDSVFRMDQADANLSCFLQSPEESQVRQTRADHRQFARWELWR